MTLFEKFILIMVALNIVLWIANRIAKWRIKYYEKQIEESRQRLAAAQKEYKHEIDRSDFLDWEIELLDD